MSAIERLLRSRRGAVKLRNRTCKFWNLPCEFRKSACNFRSGFRKFRKPTETIAESIRRVGQASW